MSKNENTLNYNAWSANAIYVRDDTIYISCSFEYDTTWVKWSYGIGRIDDELDGSILNRIDSNRCDPGATPTIDSCSAYPYFTPVYNFFEWTDRLIGIGHYYYGNPTY